MSQLIVNPQGDWRSQVGNQTDDPIRRKVVAALNAAGVPTAGARDDQLLAAYTAVVNGHASVLGANAAPEEQALLDLATEVANLVRSSSTHDLADKLGLELLKNLKSILAKPKPSAASNGAPPAPYSLSGLMSDVLSGQRNSDGTPRGKKVADLNPYDFANYDPNEFLGGTRS